MVITFEETEEAVFKKICSVLEQNQFQNVENETMPGQISEELNLSWRRQTVFVRGKAVSLSHYEISLLSYLVKHPGWIFSKEELYEAVWNESGEFCGSAVANVISQIRRKLRQAGVKREYIQTVVNSGYRFVKEDN